MSLCLSAVSYQASQITDPVDLQRGTGYHDITTVIESGYVTDAVSLPSNATVSIGTSSLPVLIITVIASVMIIVPIVIARQELPGYMPVVGSNSRAMLAASRVSPVAKIPAITAAVETELQELISAPDEGASGKSSVNPDAHRNMAFRVLKWGEVEMPEEWHREVGDAGNGREETPRIRHLSFGTVLDDPQPPTEGCFYI